MEQYEIDDLKTNLRDYLERQGIDTSKMFRCINPYHEDRNPSMRLFDNHKVYCFGCRATYDLIDTIANVENLTRKEAFKKAIEYYAKGQAVTKSIQVKKASEPTTIDKQTKDYTKAFKVWEKHFSDEPSAKNYIQSRGISLETAKRFGLGYNKFTFGNIEFKSVVIPISKNAFTARYIGEDDIEFRYYKPKNSNLEMFNQQALTNDTNYCVVVEGEFDCLSYEEIGVNCVSLGSVNNIEELEQTLIGTKKTLILALDNDEAGIKATDDIKAFCRDNKIKYKEFDNVGYKDANIALIKDRNAFEEEINKIIKQIEKRLSKESEM